MANEKVSKNTSNTKRQNGDVLKPVDAPVVPASSPGAVSSARTGSKKSAGKNRSHIGGTAIVGAKSTQPKPAPATPQQQQAESYNREMRRRMERLGTAPQSGMERASTNQQKRNRRLDRRKARIEASREEARRKGPVVKPGIGKNTIYFVVAVAAILIILFVVFALIRLNIL